MSLGKKILKELEKENPLHFTELFDRLRNEVCSRTELRASLVPLGFADKVYIDYFDRVWLNEKERNTKS